MGEAGSKKVIASSTESAARLAAERAQVAQDLRAKPVQDSLERVMRPKSVSGGMKKMGVALIATPDPITGVPGVILLASSFAMKKREPAGLNQMAKETKKVLRDIESLRI